MKRTLAILYTLLIMPLAGQAKYQQQPHAALAPDAVAVLAPGHFTKTNTTYQLVQDISSATSPVFLGNNVTLDLNGYTLTFADGYQNIPNYDFEDGLNHWDKSRAPHARIEDDKVHVFTGKHILRLKQGEEIVSDFIRLPVADRSYMAMCGVATWDMKVSLFVEDKNGNSIQCFQTVGDSIRQSCPMLNRSPRLGGGFVTAHIFGQPAGRYRVRVRAETDCLIDHVDLRPAMDVGICIVGDIYPFAHNDDLYDGRRPAFFDFAKPGSLNEPLDGIPRVKGPGSITIKNGFIKSGALGVLSWGIQSTAGDVLIILDNVKIEASGINTNAVDVPSATLTNCRFDIDTPFIINRHVSEHAVVLRGPDSSSVSHSEFFGGQGCLTIMGKNSDVHDNLFVNRQTVTNHYSIMAMGDGSTIHHNMFKPEIGSGVEIFRHKDIRIYDNEFHIEAAPPTCEYGHEEYSTTAIRVADYDAAPGAENGCSNNDIFNNTFFITGKDYPEYPDYIPMAWAFFHSVSGGDTYIYDNHIVVNHTAPNSKAEAAAIYIGGSQNGGLWENNHITSNVPAAWIASRYGNAANATFRQNTITMLDTVNKKPIRIGWKNHRAQQIRFDSNIINNSDFDFDMTEQDHTFSVAWTLTIHVMNHLENPCPDQSVVIKNRHGTTVAKARTDKSGQAAFILNEFEHENQKKDMSSPYSIHINKQNQSVLLDQNKTIQVIIDEQNRSH